MIIVLGKDGTLGRYMYDYLRRENAVLGITREIVNAANIDQARTELESLVNQGDTVVNCMGITNKKPDISITEMYTVNGVFPHILDDVCTRKGARLIHPSTGCVFTGSDGSYRSTHTTDAVDDYGMSKALGEDLKGLVIRVSIIGENPRDKSGLLEWVRSKDGGCINGYLNHQWNGITCLAYAKLVSGIIANDDSWSGVRHYMSERVTKHGLVKIITEAYGLDIRVTPHTADVAVDRTLVGEQVVDSLVCQIEEQRDYQFKPSL
jgi:dTDP-4-dehydrorhamnose reductase